MPELIPDLTPDELTTLTCYFAGQCSEAESARIAQWLAADAARRARVEALRADWAARGFLLDGEQVERQWHRLASRLVDEGSTPARIPVPALRRPAVQKVAAWRTTGWRVAAGIALAAGVGGLWSFRDRWLLGPDATTAAPTVRTVATPRGRRADVRLPDGTAVMLGPASTLRYAVSRDRGPRTVWLEGLAYVTVTHDARRPFVLRTSYGVATDLGTRFAVKAYPADSAVEVVVAEGKVALDATRGPRAGASAGAGLVLTPGDRGRATAGGKVLMERGISLGRELAWTAGRLEFQDAPLAEVVAQVGRWYDLDVRLADSALGRRQLSAVFGHEQPAADVLRAIAASASIRVEQHGRVVTLRAR